MSKQIEIEDDFNVEDYLEGATIYSNEHPAIETLKKEEFEADEVYIPEDVLSGERQWNLYWDKQDPRNAEGIMIFKERN